MGLPKIEVYTRRWCGYCVRAKAMLEERGLTYEEYDIDADSAREAEMIERSAGRRRVPQVFINGTHVGGSDDLGAAIASGELERLVAEPNR